MPQKRNPFLLEHVKGRSGRAAGAFVAAATAMHATPFANSVAVGTEGCAGVVEALGATADSVTLLRLVVSGARPQPVAMLARAAAGQTTATAAAERLVVEEGLSYREAHRLVGQRLTEAARGDGGCPPDKGGVSRQEGRPGPANGVDGLDPARVARAARFGGGPGSPPADDDLRRRRADAVTELADRLRRWRRADTELAAAVGDLIATEPSLVLAEPGGTR
jgi:argininosuccinate lyase